MLQLKFENAEVGIVTLDKSRLTFGRDKDNDIVLSAAGVSGFHAEIQTENGQSFVVDLGSQNGTFINGKKVTGRIALKAWDVLQFEKVKAEVVDPDQRRPTQVNRAVTAADLDAGQGATQVRAAIGGWSLSGVSPLVAGKAFPLTATTTVGREASCDIHIDEQLLSRSHAVLKVVGDVLTVTDQGSANGTFVNGKKVTEAVLKSGDELRFDQIVFKVLGVAGEVNKTSVRPAITNATAVRPVAAGGTQVVAVNHAVLRGDDGKVFPLRGDDVSVGRTQDNDIALDNGTVSTLHARLVAVVDGWRVVDAGSTNGTFVNGHKVSKELLKSGDKVGFGKVVMVFDDPVAVKSGTQVMPALDDTRTAVKPAAKKSLPAWMYGLIGFVVVGVGMAYVLIDSSPQVVEEKLQSGRAWSQKLDHDRIMPTTPVLADVNGDGFLDVVVADASGFVAVMDGAEGKKIFAAEVADRIVAPPVAGDLSGDGIDDIVVASNLGTVVALNGKGQPLWKSEDNLDMGEIINRPVLTVVNDDAVTDVIVPTSKRGLVALDGSRGWEIWNTAEMTQGKVVTTPLVVDLNGDSKSDYVTVTDAGQVLAVTSQDAKVWKLWEAKIPKVYYASPVFIDAGDQGVVVIATENQGIIALKADTGRVFWTTNLAKLFFASPIAVDGNGDGVNDVVAVAVNGDIHVLDSLTGDEIWSLALGVEVKASPAVYDVNDDGLLDLILLDASGKMQVIDMARGRKILTISIKGADEFVASPVLGDVNNDKLLEVVAVSQNGLVSAYGLNRYTPQSKAVWPVFLGNDLHAVK